MKAVLVFILAAFCSAGHGEDAKKNEPEPGAQSCECVPFDRCQLISALKYQFRDSSTCDSLSVCCSKQDIIHDTPSYPSKNLEGCGVRNPDGLGFRLLGSTGDEAEFGEFPWMAVVIREEEENSTKRLLYNCAGALIHPQVVTTAAHCLGDQNEKHKVRLGEWDTQAKREPYPHQDRDVKTVIRHPEFNKETFANDIALLVLEKPVEIAENVDVVCLPKQDLVLDESKCFVAGWGKNGKDGKYQEIMKKVEFPLVPSSSCQESLRKTRLGNSFQLNAGFICAGGASNQNTCEGDDGSPLVCPVPGLPGRYLQVGVVSWGVECGEGQVPGVYTNVAKYSDWIDKQLTQKNFSVAYYKY